jgi:hypothetical protein
MGMLFNGPGTQAIVTVLDQYFGLNKLPQLNAADFQGWPLQTGGGTWGYASNKHIITGNNTYDGKWMKWLKHLDLQNSNQKKNGEPTARTIGDAIADAITNYATFKRIEFFVVPDDTGTSHISAESSDVTDENGEQCKCITVYTPTYNNVKDAATRARKRKPNPKRY